MFNDHYEHDFDEELGMYWYGNPLPRTPQRPPDIVFHAERRPSQITKPAFNRDGDQRSTIDGIADRDVEIGWILDPTSGRLMTGQSQFMMQMPGEELSIHLCAEYLSMAAGSLGVSEDQERLEERFFSWVLGDRNRTRKFKTSDIPRAELMDTFLVDLRELRRLCGGTWL